MTDRDREEAIRLARFAGFANVLAFTDTIAAALATARREERERCRAQALAAFAELTEALWSVRPWDGTRIGDAAGAVDAAIRTLGEE